MLNALIRPVNWPINIIWVFFSHIVDSSIFQFLNFTESSFISNWGYILRFCQIIIDVLPHFDSFLINILKEQIEGFSQCLSFAKIQLLLIT